MLLFPSLLVIVHTASLTFSCLAKVWLRAELLSHNFSFKLSYPFYHRMAESKVTSDKIFVYFCRPLFVLSIVKDKKQEHCLCQAQHQQ